MIRFNRLPKNHEQRQRMNRSLLLMPAVTFVEIDHHNSAQCGKVTGRVGLRTMFLCGCGSKISECLVCGIVLRIGPHQPSCAFMRREKLKIKSQKIQSKRVSRSC